MDWKQLCRCLYELVCRFWMPCLRSGGELQSLLRNMLRSRNWHHIFFLSCYLVWSRMLCVSIHMIYLITHWMTIRLWWHYWRCGKQRCFQCRNGMRDTLSWRSDPTVRWWQSFEYLFLEWSSECLAYAHQHWSLWGEFYFMYSLYVFQAVDVNFSSFWVSYLTFRKENVVESRISL